MKVLKLKDLIKEALNEMISNKKSFKDMIFISFGTSNYDKNKFKQVDANHELTKLRNKPFGGLWASPIKTKYGWSDFCDSENFKLKSLAEHFIFKIDENAKIYIIDNEEDLKKISFSKGQFGNYNIDFKFLIDSDFDGIFVTYNAISNLKYGFDNINGLDTWDVESLCVFNPDIIIPIEENAFDKAKIDMHEKEPEYDEYSYYFGDSNKDDRKYLQMKSDYDKYSNQNINSDMSQFFNGKHPGISAQKHGNTKDSKLARRFNGTIKSGI